jgi:hypothetical protein
MDRNNHFEEFLSTKTDGYLMQPSSNVWNKIQQNISNKYKPTFIAITALFALMLLLTINHPTTAIAPNYDYALQNNQSELNGFENDINKEIVNNNAATINNNQLQTANSNNKIAQPIIENIVIAKTPLNENVTIVDDALNVSSNNVVAPVVTKQNQIQNRTKAEPYKELTIAANEIENLVIINEENSAKDITENIAAKNTEVVATETNVEPNTSDVNSENNSKDEVLDSETTQNNQLNAAIATSIATAKTKLKSKAQFYTSTGIGYRVLYDKRNVSNTIPFAAQTNTTGNALNGTVFHKPSASVEAGVVWIKPVTKNLEFKIGAQANYIGYKIKASDGQLQVATISLTGNSNGSQLNSLSSIRNAEGAYPKWIENSSFTMAMPIGLNFLSNSKGGLVRFGLSTTVQPSLMVKSKMLLLSTDFKNYVELPYLVRKINLNTAIETFIAVSGKKMHWQFGPQLRYQLLSTYSKKYPFKENLFDYGFKVAISKPF